jgi:hypothetical protein
MVCGVITLTKVAITPTYKNCLIKANWEQAVVLFPTVAAIWATTSKLSGADRALEPVRVIHSVAPRLETLRALNLMRVLLYPNRTSKLEADRALQLLRVNDSVATRLATNRALHKVRVLHSVAPRLATLRALHKVRVLKYPHRAS